MHIKRVIIVLLLLKISNTIHQHIKLEPTKYSTVALIGKPNAGKSTLINCLIGEEIAIATHKPQTTRTSTKGISNHDNVQLCFIDTPGLFKPNPKRNLEKFIVANARKSIKQAHIVVIVLDYSSIQNINLTIDECKTFVKQITSINPKASKNIIIALN